MARIIDPGRLSVRLVLERPVDVPDGQGGVTRSFSALASLWARIEPVVAKADEAAGAVPVTVTHRIWLRWRDDLVGGMRLRKGARLFAIRAFRDPDEAGRYVLCDCEEIKS
ncbi:phage head closure protein [Shinella kummerowiae]|jgi:SPP1 family predicted phage head-tail adaptor|uniref:Phage head closure protein n=1 Tax=Shinella kummerowiae TaxID=417745 RepID=A0A6N8SJX8_9HYPH|nr:phage head closure protein [Shinella kummerowiae]MXN47120.1 phage head closure protein [Shinella kummerowiae]